jgi:nucleoid-associated protein YgaU
VAEAAPVRTYTVQPKDSLIKIARKVYSTDGEDEYKRILEANRDKIKHPSLLAIGQELVIPELDVKLTAVSPGAADVQQVDLDQLTKALTPGESEPIKAEPIKDAKPVAKSVYVVQRGDTLTKIARKTLKDDSRATIMRIVAANKGKVFDPNRLPVGLKLEIPS